MHAHHTREWEEQIAMVLVEALQGKFLQNAPLAKCPKETHPRHLGEASREPVWGTGLYLSDKETINRTKWNKQGNLDRSLWRFGKNYWHEDSGGYSGGDPSGAPHSMLTTPC